jgi:hypothetical protein
LGDAVTTGEWAGIIGGSIGVLTTLGAGFKWLFTRADRREDALIKKLEARINALEGKDAEREKEHHLCQSRVEKLLFTCTLLIEEFETVSPSPTIARARRYIEREFPEAFGKQPPIPKDMLNTLKKLD